MKLKNNDRVRIHKYSAMFCKSDMYGTVTKVSGKKVRVVMRDSLQVIWADQSNFTKI